jgi:hypothetical protein
MLMLLPAVADFVMVGTKSDLWHNFLEATWGRCGGEGENERSDTQETSLPSTQGFKGTC